MMTPKRNSCVTLAFSKTHLKMYGKGTKIDEIRESTTIDTSFDISRVIVVIALRFQSICGIAETILVPSFDDINREEME